MTTIPTIPFGHTGHDSSRIIFGGYALSDGTLEETDEVFSLLLKYGINHIDTAPMYGKAEVLIGQWLSEHENDFFLATKTRNRAGVAAMETLQKSLQNLQVDTIDLWQMHGLTNPVGWAKAMGPGGTLEAFIEAKETGLVHYLGVTGHGTIAPKMHIQSLERYDFDSILLPYNFLMMQKAKYASQFNELLKMCQEKEVALQTIKSVSRRPWEGQPRDYNTYFYEPLADQESIDLAIHWAMGLEGTFVITAGDLQIVPKILDAASRYTTPPSNDTMQEFLEYYEIKPIFK